MEAQHWLHISAFPSLGQIRRALPVPHLGHFVFTRRKYYGDYRIGKEEENMETSLYGGWEMAGVVKGGSNPFSILSLDGGGFRQSFFRFFPLRFRFFGEVGLV